MNQHPGYNLRWVKRKWWERTDSPGDNKDPSPQIEAGDPNGYIYVLQALRPMPYILTSHPPKLVFEWVDVPVEEE